MSRVSIYILPQVILKTLAEVAIHSAGMLPASLRVYRTLRNMSFRSCTVAIFGPSEKNDLGLASLNTKKPPIGDGFTHASSTLRF